MIGKTPRPSQASLVQSSARDHYDWAKLASYFEVLKLQMLGNFKSKSSDDSCVRVYVWSYKINNTVVVRACWLCDLKITTHVDRILFLDTAAMIS